MSKSKKIKFVTDKDRETYELMERIEAQKKINDKRVLKKAMEEHSIYKPKEETYQEQTEKMRSGGKAQFQYGKQRITKTTEDTVMRNLFGNGKND